VLSEETSETEKSWSEGAVSSGLWKYSKWFSYCISFLLLLQPSTTNMESQISTNAMFYSYVSLQSKFGLNGLSSRHWYSGASESSREKLVSLMFSTLSSSSNLEVDHLHIFLWSWHPLLSPYSNYNKLMNTLGTGKPGKHPWLKVKWLVNLILSIVWISLFILQNTLTGII
jgi:hypothetical protein